MRRSLGDAPSAVGPCRSRRVGEAYERETVPLWDHVRFNPWILMPS